MATQLALDNQAVQELAVQEAPDHLVELVGVVELDQLVQVHQLMELVDQRESLVGKLVVQEK